MMNAGERTPAGIGEQTARIVKINFLKKLNFFYLTKSRK
jgi:hypothetical protein